MAETITDLRLQMEAAAARSDFEEAARLRDRISILRASPDTEEEPNFDTSGLTRQRPGSMGLGTSRQSVTPPEGWKPPKKPDPMTRRKK